MPIRAAQRRVREDLNSFIVVDLNVGGFGAGHGSPAGKIPGRVDLLDVRRKQELHRTASVVRETFLGVRLSPSHESETVPLLYDGSMRRQND